MKAEAGPLRDANEFCDIHKVPDAVRPMVRLAYLAGRADGDEVGYERGRFEGYQAGTEAGYDSGYEQAQAIAELG